MWQAVIMRKARVREGSAVVRRPNQDQIGGAEDSIWGHQARGAQFGAGERPYRSRKYSRTMGCRGRSGLPGARPGSGSSDQTPQVRTLVGPQASQGPA